MRTHHVCAFGLEGVGATGVEMRAVVALQETNVVEALGLCGSEERLLGMLVVPSTKAAIKAVLSFVKVKLIATQRHSVTQPLIISDLQTCLCLQINSLH